MSFSESANVQNKFVHFLLLNRLFQECNNRMSMKLCCIYNKGV